MIHHLYSNIVADCQEFSPYTNFTQLYLQILIMGVPIHHPPSQRVGRFCYPFKHLQKIWNFY